MTKKSGNDSNSQTHKAKPIETAPKPTAAVSKPITAKPTGPPNVSFKSNAKVWKK